MSEETALRQIYERLGSIDAKLDSGAKKMDEQGRDIRSMQERMAGVPALAETVKKMEPIVNDYRDSRNKLTGAFLVLSMVAGGIGFFAAEIRGMLIRAFS